jgi:hypothetical protein
MVCKRNIVETNNELIIHREALMGPNSGIGYTPK